MSVRNLAASVRARLLNKAHSERLDFNLLLTRYALERILFRLSVSDRREHFLLKGALLFDLWFDQPHRPTHDADLLGYGTMDIARLEVVFRDICRIDADDGIVFQAESVKATGIRKEARYAGIRVRLMGVLHGAQCPVQIDVGFGDAVTPGPEEVSFPVLLDDMPRPRLRAYPRYTVVAEKFEAMVSLGMKNTRMKDYFDLWVLMRHSEFDRATLHQAICATFERRGTAIPAATPVGLSDEFAQDGQKNTQWNAFLRRNALEAPVLPDVAESLRAFLLVDVG